MDRDVACCPTASAAARAARAIGKCRGAILLTKTFLDDRMRAGLGKGCHASFVPITRHGIRCRSVIGVKLTDRALQRQKQRRAAGQSADSVGGR
jgi:hypothetical protein